MVPSLQSLGNGAFATLTHLIGFLSIVPALDACSSLLAILAVAVISTCVGVLLYPTVKTVAHHLRAPLFRAPQAESELYLVDAL
eukprot:5328058-Pleurochrysis_carterae.AAC.1